MTILPLIRVISALVVALGILCLLMVRVGGDVFGKPSASGTDSKNVEICRTKQPPDLSKILAKKARISESDWDSLMERLLASDDIPFESRLVAFNELSHLRRLRLASMFFDDFAKHRAIDDCLQFCSALPFDSSSQHDVSRKLVAKILEACDFYTAVDYIGRMDLGIPYAATRMVERDLPSSFHLRDVLDFKRRFPAEWESALLSCIVTNSKSALDYQDLKSLFPDADNSGLLGRAVSGLASQGKLSYPNLLDVMDHPVLSIDQKKTILASAARSSTPPDISAFESLLASGLPSELVDAYICALPTAIERNNPGNAAGFASLIRDASTRRLFLLSAAREWSLALGTVDGNPYLNALEPGDIEVIKAGFEKNLKK